MYDGRKNSDRPRTLIFRVLRWHDRSEILKGARQAYPVKCSGKAAAALSTARREGLGGRDGGDAGCPEEDGGGRDMDAC